MDGTGNRRTGVCLLTYGYEGCNEVVVEILEMRGKR
jgi:hypothetical protein